MNVFIIWSGKASKAIAEAFHNWLPQVIQEVKPWMSAKDIDKGAHWPTELAEKLEEVNFAIVCLTPDNIEAPWILFESGATSKAVGEAHVSPYLFKLKSTDLTGPLSLYQITESNKEDTFELIKTINKTIGDKALKDETLKKAFDMWWPEFEGKLQKIEVQAKKELKELKPHRTSDEKIDEILQIVRILSREQREQLGRTIQEKVDNLYEVFETGTLSGLAKLAGQIQASKAFETVAREFRDTENVHEYIDPLEKDKEDKSE
jgi:hypothetical protein